jgi:hypothetical protein
MSGPGWWIVLGAAFGVVFGSVFGHLAYGIIIGAALGVVVGSVRASVRAKGKLPPPTISGLDNMTKVALRRAQPVESKPVPS